MPSASVSLTSLLRRRGSASDRGQNFHRAGFPDRGLQVWSFLHDDADPKLMLAGGPTTPLIVRTTVRDAGLN
jgi:hypothetical protein